MDDRMEIDTARLYGTLSKTINFAVSVWYYLLVLLYLA